MAEAQSSLVSPTPVQTEPASASASARHRIVALGASLAFLSFLDRAAISQAAPAIIRDLHVTSVQMGMVFSAFGIPYALGGNSKRVALRSAQRAPTRR